MQSLLHYYCIYYQATAGSRQRLRYIQNDPYLGPTAPGNPCGGGRLHLAQAPMAEEEKFSLGSLQTS